MFSVQNVIIRSTYNILNMRLKKFLYLIKSYLFICKASTINENPNIFHICRWSPNR